MATETTVEVDVSVLLTGFRPDRTGIVWPWPAVLTLATPEKNTGESAIVSVAMVDTGAFVALAAGELVAVDVSVTVCSVLWGKVAEKQTPTVIFIT